TGTVGNQRMSALEQIGDLPGDGCCDKHSFFASRRVAERRSGRAGSAVLCSSSGGCSSFTR
ncbi:MAG: hypothetical protein JSW38_05170, partial [Dehalococcoidia bacterium]